MGSLFLNINAGSINIRLGGLAGGPIHGWTVQKVDSSNITLDGDATGSMYMTPFAGIGFAF